MKASFFALFAFAASAIASPLAVRQDESQIAEIQSLFTQVQGYTGAINQTTAGLSDSSTADEQTAAITAVTPQLQGITDALTQATKVVSKRAIENLVAGRGFGAPDLLAEVYLLVWEIAFTLKVLIIKLGLAPLLFALTPLILSLSGLLHALDAVVDGLLIAVKAILANVLGGVAFSLLGLI